MLKLDERLLEKSEARYPGIVKQIMRFENATLPPCELCGSKDTADVQIGILGRTITIAAATTKFALIPNGPRPGLYRCNACKHYFGESAESS